MISTFLTTHNSLADCGFHAIRFASFFLFFFLGCQSNPRICHLLLLFLFLFGRGVVVVVINFFLLG